MRKDTGMKIASVILAGLMMISVFGCSATKTVKPEETEPEELDTKLTVIETEWNDQGSTEEDTVVYTSLSEGDVVYDEIDGKITVKSVSEKKIVLCIEDGCFVEPNENGGINLNADPLKVITLKCGESIELASQTMDEGVNLYIAYE